MAADNGSKRKRRVEVPECGTGSSLAYFWASHCDTRLFWFVSQTVIVGDFTLHVTSEALEGRKVDEALTPITLAQQSPGPRTRMLRRSNPELLQMFLCRAVDNFQVYIVEIVRSVLHKQPRILSASKKELSLGYILGFDSIEALTRDLIESKVTSLSYDGFGDLESWCSEKGIPLVVPHGERDRVVELIAMRNLIVHNRALVDDRFRKAVPSCTVCEGDQLRLSIDDWFSAVDLLDQVVFLTDVSTAGKFGLETVEVRKSLEERAKERWSAPEAESESMKNAEEPSRAPQLEPPPP